MWMLLIPPAALLLALLWTASRGRPKRAREAMITIEGYRRSMDALARPVDPVSRSSPDGGRAPAAGSDEPEAPGRPAKSPSDRRGPGSRRARVADAAPQPAAEHHEAHAVYPDDVARGPGAVPTAYEAMVERPGESPRVGAVVPAARAVEGRTPAGSADAKPARLPESPEAPGSQGGESAHPVG
ncbi:hypothetical protein [Pseudofrankia asymbiotica]|uniref:Uncharacterized protein n=1 Tax=Pseudofrankia asymbiotica TaxID=1834516 RepID=A0A1V2IL35_9ACTN|nr:hypothetical protein [Pseudofrankia asymbiotica]ONH33817.1 hypothetical protein BL253_00360 [Pseudofrankia asymbiotica]